MLLIRNIHVIKTKQKQPEKGKISFTKNDIVNIMSMRRNSLNVRYHLYSYNIEYFMVHIFIYLTDTECVIVVINFDVLQFTILYNVIYGIQGRQHAFFSSIVISRVY